MPAITEIGQLWTPAESFLIDLSTDPYRAERREAQMYDTDEQIQAGLVRLVTQIRDTTLCTRTSLSVPADQQ